MVAYAREGSAGILVELFAAFLGPGDDCSMIRKVLDYALVLLIVIMIAFVAYQMFGDPLSPDPNAPPIVEPRYRK